MQSAQVGFISLDGKPPHQLFVRSRAMRRCAAPNVTTTARSPRTRTVGFVPGSTNGNGTVFVHQGAWTYWGDSLWVPGAGGGIPVRVFIIR